jgi:predicted N-acetyltransferase YhbS
VTFVALDPIDGRVVGYYAALAYQLDLGEAAIAFGVGKRRYPIPALLLARLAVCRTAQKTGLGERLLIHALAGFARISESVGAEVVVVHAADETAATFYARYGFIRFASHDLHLYLPTRTIRRLFPD